MRAIFRGAVMILLGLLASPMAPASRAGSLAYTASTAPKMTTDFSVALSVPAFDTTLGTLKDIVISYVDDANMQGTVINTSASAQTFKVTETVNFGLYLGGTELLSNDLTGQGTFSKLGVNAEANFGAFTPGGSSGPFLIVDGPLFGAFEARTSTVGGPSPKVTFQFQTLTTTKVAGGGGNITTGIYTKADATVTVLYEYGLGITVTPAVPEPSAAILTGLGGLCVASGWLVRRRARARGPAGR